MGSCSYLRASWQSSRERTETENRNSFLKFVCIVVYMLTRVWVHIGYGDQRLTFGVFLNLFLLHLLRQNMGLSNLACLTSQLALGSSASAF